MALPGCRRVGRKWVPIIQTTSRFKLGLRTLLLPYSDVNITDQPPVDFVAMNFCPRVCERWYSAALPLMEFFIEINYDITRSQLSRTTGWHMEWVPWNTDGGGFWYVLVSIDSFNAISQIISERHSSRWVIDLVQRNRITRHATYVYAMHHANKTGQYKLCWAEALRHTGLFAMVIKNEY